MNAPNNRYQQTVRFWEYVNDGPVKITLRPGQTLTHYQGEPDDEGWSSFTQIWEYDDVLGIVEREQISDGSDCDGRLTRAYADHFRVGQERAGLPAGMQYAGRLEYPELIGVVYPFWRDGDSSQRDYQAEAAGY